jgi:fatty acid-binding protein DegV
MTVAVIVDADACVPEALAAALDIRTAPADAPLLLEPETIPQLRSEAADLDATPAIEASRAATADGATELLYLNVGDGFGSAPDLAELLPAALKDGVRIVVDSSESALMGCGWQAVAAAEAIRGGGDLDAALAAARDVRGTVRVLVMLEHPELATAAGAAALDQTRQRVLAELRGSELGLMGLYKERNDALQQLRDRFASSIKDGSRAHIAVHHAGAGPGAEALARWIERELNPARLVVAPLTRHAAARLGPRMLGIAWHED